MNSSPLVSIIVPNYNHESFLAQRLESIFNQSYLVFEVILLDDFSMDCSTSILEKYASRSQVSHYIKNEENSGSPFIQWKKGIALAKSDFIWIAESDDLAEIDFLEKGMNYLLKNESDLLYTDSKLIDEKNEIGQLTFNQETLNKLDTHRWKQSYSTEGSEELSKYFIHQTTIPNASAVIFNKKLMSNIPWDLIGVMKLAGDKVFWAYCMSKARISYLNEPLNYHRHHQGTQRSRADLHTWFFETLYFISYISTSISKELITDKFHTFTNQFTINITDYSLNLKILFPYLKQLNSLNRHFYLNFVFFKLPKSILRTILKRILKRVAR